MPRHAACARAWRTLGCAGALLVSAPAIADVIVHTNGQRFEGIILSESEQRVVIRLPGGELSLPRTVIERIERDDPLANAVLRIDAAFRTANVIGGMTALIDALELGAEPRQLNETLLRNKSVFLRGLAALRPTDRIEARHQLKRIQSSGMGNHETNLLLAQGFLEMDLPMEASDCLQEAGLERLREDPETQRWAVAFLRELVRKLVIQGRHHDAIEQIERLRLLDAEEAETQVPLMYLVEAARNREADQFERALQILSERLWPIVPEIARDRSLVTIRRMTRWAETTRSEREARRWIEQHLSPHMPVEALAAIHKLYETEARRLINSDQATRAMRLLDQVPEVSRPPELQRLWAEARFYSERAALGDNDPPALFELARWAAEKELYEQAFLLFEELRANPLLRELADEQVLLMRKERDLFLLRRALKLYELGLMDEVAELCNEIIADPDRESEVLRQAKGLADLVTKEVAIEKHNEPYVAEAYFQQAERAYFLDDIDQAWNYIDLLLTHYAETPAAERAAALLPDVMRQLELQLLEGRRRSVPNFDSPVSMSELRRSERLDEEIRLLFSSL